MKTWLVDTGPLVAYLDARDPHHRRVSERLGRFRGALATTSAVITEAMHFVSGAAVGPRRLAELVMASRMSVLDLTGPRELDAAATLMEKYADTPMNFADATLMLLAEALGHHSILTLDRRGFSTFRTRAGRSFRLVLDRSDCSPQALMPARPLTVGAFGAGMTASSVWQLANVAQSWARAAFLGPG